MKPSEKQYRVLKALQEAQINAHKYGLRLSMPRFADTIGMNYNTLNTHITRLVKKGYLRKDRRTVTKKGLELM